MNTKDLISLHITRQTAAVSREGFSNILFVGVNATFKERVRTYGNLQEVGKDFKSDTEEYVVASRVFSQNPAPNQIKIGRLGASEDIKATLDLIATEDNDWYILLAHSHAANDILTFAEWTEANKRIYITSYSGDDATDTTSHADPGSKLKEANFDRTAIMYTTHSEVSGVTEKSYPEAAWAGRQSTTVEGATTWAYKTLVGVKADNLSTTQIRTLMGTSTKRGKGYNVYTSTGGRNITMDGRMASGEYIDVIRGCDALEARIRERVFSLLINVDKLPYNSVGAAQIESCIRAALSEFNARGFIEADYTVTVPDLRSSDPNLRANRIAEGFAFAANLTGGIHYVGITGTLSI